MAIQRIDDGDRLRLLLETGGTAYVLGLDRGREPPALLLGATAPLRRRVPDARRLSRSRYLNPHDSYKERIREEAAPWSGIWFKKPVVKATFPTELGRSSWRTTHAGRRPGAARRLPCRSPTVFNLFVDLTYLPVEGRPLLERSVTVTTGVTAR